MNFDLDDVIVPETPVKRERTTGPLYFDIETIPDFSRESVFDEAGMLPDVPESIPETAPEHLLDPEEFVSQSLDECRQMLAKLNPPDSWIDSAIAAEKASGKKTRKGLFDLFDAVKDRRSAATKANAERNKAMSVTPEMCRIVAIGYGVGDVVISESGFDIRDGIACIDDATETALLDDFWQMLAHHRGPLVGFNVFGFDLPVIFVRSAILGVEPTRSIDTKPWGKDVIDLMYARFPKSKATGLKTMAKLYGIDIPTGDVDGGAVLDLFLNDPSRIAEYVKSDIIVTRELHRRFRGFFCA